MRWVLLSLSLLGGCGSLTEPIGAFAAADAANVVVLHRSIFDAVFSIGSGRDCSVVRLGQGKSYCRPLELPPERPAFCTRSLARVECWANPEALAGRPTEVADGPRVLTPAQEANRTRRWPDF